MDGCVQMACVLFIQGIYILGVPIIQGICHLLCRYHLRNFPSGVSLSFKEFICGSYMYAARVFSLPLSSPPPTPPSQDCVFAVCRWLSAYGWAEGVRSLGSPLELRKRVGNGG